MSVSRPGYALQRGDAISALSVGIFLSWFSLAFRLVGAPVVSIGIPALSYPRDDEAWLAALAAVVLAGMLSAVVLSRPAHGRGTAWSVSRLCTAVPATGAVLMSAGSLVLLFMSSDVALTVAAGALCGVGLTAYLAFWFAGLPGVPSRAVVLRMGLGCVVAGCVDLVLAALVEPVLHIVVGVLPLASCGLMVAERTRRKGVSGIGDGDGAEAGDAFSAGGLRTARIPTLVLSLFGCSFFMGVVGFEVAMLESGITVLNWAFIMAGAGFIAGVVLGVSWFRSDGVLLHLIIPLMLATAMLLLPLSSALPLTGLAVVLDQSSLLCAYGLLLCVVRERLGGSPRSGLAKCFFVLALVGACQLVGILAGGVVRGVFGFNLTTVTITALFALYFIILAALGMARGGQRRVEHVIVGRLADAGEVARLRAQVIVRRRGGISERELEVLTLLLRGYSNARIAEALGVSENTVKTHVRHVYDKIGVGSRGELLSLAEEIALDDLEVPSSG